VSDLETGSQALIGTAVHRLFELQGRDSVDASAPETLSERLKTLIRDEEVVETDDLDAALRQAVEAYLQLRADPEVESSLRAGDAWFEVPFSVRPAGAATVLRGTFDCLIRTRDGRVRLLEFKTGRPSLRHKEQLAIYLSAARALFPETAVEGMLVYACGRNQTGQKGV
jgi:RecB family exonuclease